MRRYRVEVPTEDYWRRQINCQYACPVNTDARGYVRAIADGRFDDAYLIARGPNPLASICGRVCGAPCEAACRRGDIDQAVSIRALKRFAQERFAARHSGSQGVPPGLLRRLMDHAAGRNCSAAEELGGMRQILGDGELPNNEGGEPVAIIGSGPAGLAAAHDLALLGCRPTIFEMEPIPAGMLAVGIPLYICATASTPIAAALILKGVSPGAALVFLLAGPATNVTSLTVLLRVLGKRATAIYLTMIALFSVLFGLAVDQVYTLLGIEARAMVGQAAEWVPPWAQLLGALTLLALSVRPVSRTLRAKLERTLSRLGLKEEEEGISPGEGTEDVGCAGTACDCSSGARDPAKAS
jgi:hypothetical protein